ncbi:MAG: TetR family transcriptional regulator [Gammaproteobacteria bacterium]|nr:TetR family transcriptional regulator [Gammaproteobacteria bacterium]
MGNMKNAIKTISINLFYKKGYFATSISDIAREAGIQKSSIYYHYSNKEELLFDILKTTMVDLDENLESQIKGVQGAEEKMRAAIQSHVIFHMERQKEVIISDSELRGLTVDNYKNIMKMRDDYERKFQSLIKEGIEKGIFADMDFKVASYGIITMCTAVSIWFNQSGRLSKEDVAKIYTDFIIHGLKG